MSLQFEKLGREVIDALGERPPEDVLRDQRARIVRPGSFPSLEKVSLRSPRWKVAVGTCTAAAAVVLGASWARSPGAQVGLHIPASLRGGKATEPDDEHWVEAPADGAKPVAFADGSEVRLQSGARGRIQGESTRKVRVTLESGRMDMAIEPNTGTMWSFQAGAYRLEATGTVFYMDYQPSDGALEIGVSHGRVVVKGGELAQEAVSVEGGRRFTASHGALQLSPVEGQSSLTEAADPDPELTDTLRERANFAAPVRASKTGTRPERTERGELRGWRKAYAAANYAGALGQAEREGFEHWMEAGGTQDLADLADAARLSGNDARAEQALLALRGRFARTGAAGTAAFLLGRLSADRRRDPTAARKWFETYLQEQPQGSYAAEALGRAMVAADGSHDSGASNRLALQYLARYPRGPYREVAQRLALAR